MSKQQNTPVLTNSLSTMVNVTLKLALTVEGKVVEKQVEVPAKFFDVLWVHPRGDQQKKERPYRVLFLANKIPTAKHPEGVPFDLVAYDKRVREIEMGSSDNDGWFPAVKGELTKKLCKGLQVEHDGDSYYCESGLVGLLEGCTPFLKRIPYEDKDNNTLVDLTIGDFQ